MTHDLRRKVTCPHYLSAPRRGGDTAEFPGAAASQVIGVWRGRQQMADVFEAF